MHIIKTSVYGGAIRSMVVSLEGHIYVGNQDTSIKLYKAEPKAGSKSSAANGIGGARLSKDDARSSVINSMNGRRGSLYAAGAAGGVEVRSDSDDVTYDQVQVADCSTQASNGHVGCVNALVLCGKYVCSAAGDAMVRGGPSGVRCVRYYAASVLQALPYQCTGSHVPAAGSIPQASSLRQ